LSAGELYIVLFCKSWNSCANASTASKLAVAFRTLIDKYQAGSPDGQPCRPHTRQIDDAGG
jgi:hypothetical protein